LNLRKGGDGGNTLEFNPRAAEITSNRKGWFNRLTNKEKEAYREKIKVGINKWKHENPDRLFARQNAVKETRLKNGSYKHSDETKKKISLNNSSYKDSVKEKIRNKILGRIWIKKENFSMLRNSSMIIRTAGDVIHH
jgi:hypothetical protein